MPDDNKIKQFTAADIEKYHKGLLSSKERHDLEKAALDDPFLSDALEGYAMTGVNVTNDVAELKKRLAERIEGNKVIAMPVRQRTSFTWWRIAAMLVLIAGAGILVYEFGFNKKSNQETIAQNKPGGSTSTLNKDSVSPNAITEQKIQEPSVSTSKTSSKESSGKVSVTNEVVNTGRSAAKTDTVSLSMNEVAKQRITISPAPKQETIYNGSKKSKEEMNDMVANNGSKANEQMKLGEVSTAKTLSAPNESVQNDQQEKNDMIAASKTKQPLGYSLRSENFLHNNIFRGRIVDVNNNPLPFANITNVEDSVGTYADAQGYFNLTSPDSIMNVRVQSLGFTNTITELKHTASDNEIKLKEDKSLNAVILSNKKPNTLSRDANVKIEEPEPADGWDKYDIYLANNLDVPDVIRSKYSSKDVEVSFNVDKNGDPTNIKVEKSLCNQCDQAAIQLIKKGPKWKNKFKKKRATVKILF